MILTEILNKLLITVALVATQMEVAVDSLNAVPHFEQNAQQGDTVGTTAEGYEVQAFARQQPLFFNICLNSINHIFFCNGLQD